jgi:hypothetical protein
MTTLISDTEVINIYNNLPVKVKEQVYNYMQFLIVQYHLDSFIENRNITEENLENKRILGGLEGKIWISPDFNEPLDDFKDYM